MLGYVLLALLLVVALPIASFFTGYMDAYLRFGPSISGAAILMWVVRDIKQMVRRRR